MDQRPLFVAFISKPVSPLVSHPGTRAKLNTTTIKGATCASRTTLPISRGTYSHQTHR
jgi:hypothetical protein